MASAVARSVLQSYRAPAESPAPNTSPAFPRSDRSADLSSAAAIDDLSREVYCILGMPIDAVQMPAVMQTIAAAAARAVPFVISTPNINYLVRAQTDPEFSESVLLSDLCPADGMPIVWIARLMGIPIKQRIAGSDIFEALKARPHLGRPLRVFLFGAQENIAAAAAGRLNLTAGVKCVGWICPGWGNVDELSQKAFIDRINLSNADLLVASLSAVKGQLWLHRNYRLLRIPIRASLGATINFQAGTVKRAPHAIQKLGLEWLWRIKEEPYLWRRYLYDGSVMLQLLLTRVLPLAIRARWLQRQCRRHRHDLIIQLVHSGDSVTVALSGFAVADQIEQVISCFREALTAKKHIVIDFSKTRAVDARLLGLLLMLRKQLKARKAVMRLIGTSPRLERMFRLYGLGNLLSVHAEKSIQDRQSQGTIYTHLPPEELASPSMPPFDQESTVTGKIITCQSNAEPTI
jgi:N-acetylglucosaminyldiphosphoundecaprenol N-acetyl-beta-D-mannosaminyltransferase